MTDRADDCRPILDTVSKRAPVLESLLEEPLRKTDIVDRVSLSRSTVNRAIRELENAGFVRSERGVYDLTAAGRAAFRSYRQTCAELEGIVGARDLLSYLPEDAVPPAEMLAGVETVPRDEMRPGQYVAEMLDSVESLLGWWRPHEFPSSIHSLHRAVGRDGSPQDISLAVDRSLIGRTTRQEARKLGDIFTAEGVSVSLVDPLPFVLFVLDGDATRACLTVHSGEGLKGLLVNDRPEAVSWARRQVRSRLGGDGSTT